MASSYTVIITQHTLTMVEAFHLKRYASGFGLARLVLEALLKQMAVFVARRPARRFDGQRAI